MTAEELARALGAKLAPKGFGRKVVPMFCERAAADEAALGHAGWLYELKLDGVRIVADKRSDAVTLAYRKLRDATSSYAEIARAVATLPCDRLVLDGEIVAFDEHGRPDFQRLASRIHAWSAARSPEPVVYVVFDVLGVGPYDVTGLPIEARKEILARIVPSEGGAAGGLVRAHPTFDDGRPLFALCRELGLEGVVAKRRGSLYRSGERIDDWRKLKHEREADLVVIGWTEGSSAERGGRRVASPGRIGALELGAYEGDRLVFRGRVGSGIDEAESAALLAELRELEVPHPVAEAPYPKHLAPGPRHHARPVIVVSVRHTGFTAEGEEGGRYLRHAVFRGVRPDVDPRECNVAPVDGPADLAGAVASAARRARKE